MRLTRLSRFFYALALAAFALAPATAQEKKLRLLTWADYAPKEVELKGTFQRSASVSNSW